jgi:hypothetical protein
MVCVEDYPWLLGLTAPGRLTQTRRRLSEEGLTPAQPEHGVSIIERRLAADGPLTRSALAEHVEHANIRAAGQAVVLLIILTALRGVLIPARGLADEQTLALTDDWLGARPPAELHGDARDAALGELARRYLQGHGPARDRDLARWAGLGLRDVRRGLSSLNGLVELGGGIVDLPREPLDTPVGALLLPSFDPYMLGWEDRSFAVAPEHTKRVHPGGGMLLAVACLGGLTIATWTARRRAAGLTVTLEPFAPFTAGVDRALETEVADVARFEGLAVNGC